MNGREMVKCDIEKLIYAYLCEERADYPQLLIRFKSDAESLRIIYRLGLICFAKRKSQFHIKMQFQGSKMMFETYLRCWNFRLLHFFIPRFIPPAPGS